MYQFLLNGQKCVVTSAAHIAAAIGFDKPDRWSESKYRFRGRTRMETRGWHDCVNGRQSLYFVLLFAGKENALAAYVNGWREGNAFRAQFEQSRRRVK